MEARMGDPEPRLIELGGDAFEQGEAQGRAFRDRLPETWEALTRLGIAPAWLPAPVHRGLVRTAVDAAGRFYLGRHRRLLRRHDGGRQHAFLHGLARGLDVSPARAYGLNAYEIENCTVGYSLGCTSLVFPGSRTASGEPRLAYNHDFPPSFEALLTVRRCTPETGYRSLNIGYGLMLGAISGVNERGLAASIDQAFATDGLRLRAGLLPSAVLRECLDTCATVREAILRIRGVRLTNGSMITLLDASGDRAVVEFSSTRSRVRRERPDRILYTFNKYRAPAMESVEMPVGALTRGLVPGIDVHSFNTSRTERFLALERPDADIGDDDIQRVMADHGGDGCRGDSTTICRHDDPLAETLCTAIVDPVQRSMKVLFGKPCERRFRRYGLEIGRRAADADRACA
jgi:hypothetical protein